jgi:hypothetical protein
MRGKGLTRMCAKTVQSTKTDLEEVPNGDLAPWSIDTSGSTLFLNIFQFVNNLCFSPSRLVGN